MTKLIRYFKSSGDTSDDATVISMSNKTKINSFLCGRT